MEGADSFFTMGGYAAYVWPSLLMTAGVMLVLLVLSRRRLRENQRAVEQLEAQLPDREARRAARRKAGPQAGEESA